VHQTSESKSSNEENISVLDHKTLYSRRQVEVEVEVEVEVTTDSQSASLSWCQAPIWSPWPDIFSVWRLRVSCCEAPSLTRGRVCNLLCNCFWALPEQSLLSPSPAELTAIFYSLIWDSPNLEGQVPVFISPRNRVAQLYPRALGFQKRVQQTFIITVRYRCPL
jgi:hypothetical protein